MELDCERFADPARASKLVSMLFSEMARRDWYPVIRTDFPLVAILEDVPG